MKFFQKFTANVKILVFLYCFLAVSTCLLIYSAVMVNSITYSQSRNYNNHLRYHIANDSFRRGTDRLTDAVRRYVVTMNPEFIEHYFDEAYTDRHRDKALQMVSGLQIDQSLKDTINNAMRVSLALMQTE